MASQQQTLGLVLAGAGLSLAVLAFLRKKPPDNGGNGNGNGNGGGNGGGLPPTNGGGPTGELIALNFASGLEQPRLFVTVD